MPTAMSLLASLMSAASLLGIPVEIYSYGTMYCYWRKIYFPLKINHYFWISSCLFYWNLFDCEIIHSNVSSNRQSEYLCCMSMHKKSSFLKIKNSIETFFLVSWTTIFINSSNSYYILLYHSHCTLSKRNENYQIFI